MNTFNLEVNPLPETNFPADAAICEGDSVTLDAGSHAAIIWFDGDSVQYKTVDTSGSYSVLIQDSNLCSNRDTVEMFWRALPVVNLGDDTTICDTSSVSPRCRSGIC